jgi:hypothetical protein
MAYEEKIQRMIRPDELKKNEPLVWSTGTGTDVWFKQRSALPAEGCGNVQTTPRNGGGENMEERLATGMRSEPPVPLNLEARENTKEMGYWPARHRAAATVGSA